MSNPPVPIGYVMSTSQLNHLWHYDMYLANVLLDLPLRTCSAEPVKELDGFPTMTSEDFLNLKAEVRKMWTFASNHFFCKQGIHGWGLYFAHNCDTNPKPFTATRSAIMGWLAKAPSVQQCPTGHRYLRSPCDGDDNIYLGGPISLANFDEMSRVTCMRCISLHEPRRFKVAVSKAPGKKIAAGQEVLWTYCLDAFSKLAPSFYDVTEWQQDHCCSEVQKSLDSPELPNKPEVTVSQPSSLEPLSQTEDSVPTKKRKMGGPKPKTTIKCAPVFKLCPYCGLNLASELSVGKKDNMKRHWALKHAADLCKEMGGTVDDEDSPISAKEFMKHLDKVTNVFNGLRDHGYKIVPACNFFENTGTPLLNAEASVEEKQAVFDAFIAEGKSAFQKYQVLYLKGISVPESYDDLLKPTECTNYSNVTWEESRPSGNNFSINHYKMDEREAAQHALDIQTVLGDLSRAWSLHEDMYEYD